MKKKKMLLTAAAMLTGLTVHAADYGYLTFQQADGTLTTLAAEGLKITFADGKLIAKQGTQTATLDLNELKTMFFSNDGSTSVASINGNAPKITISNGQIQITTKENASAKLYRIDGRTEGSQNIDAGQTVTLAKGLAKGIYIVSINGVKTKVLVK